MSSPDRGATAIRREEQIRVGTETVLRETVRIEKVIVTEQRTFTVDVRREELRITRTPAPLAAASRPPQTTRNGMPIILVLREEQVIITKTVVPTEQITLNVVRVTEDQHVTESVRQEHIDTTVESAADQ